ncbi:hypothetical protein EV424DRAFT_1541678 [Suillus variegatus]|nr:hypothetical protein EV424DRAFT_1541678 [Suillus variegatus]
MSDREPKTFLFKTPLEKDLTRQLMHAQYIRTDQEYAIKILDKNHLIRKDKMLVALAEKDIIVKLGVRHSGTIRLH